MTLPVWTAASSPTSRCRSYEGLIQSTQASQPGELIGMNIGPDEIHIMKRSEV